jgi:hypothetical protein
MRLLPALPERTGNAGQNGVFCSIPRHCISYLVLIATGYLESRNDKLVNNTCYTEFRCKVS